ncbi:MAG: hypothetical protein M3Y87_10985, partial [Myxococcota bacterium]|nr:hypothetical protein [Myxococcota bacterium]
WTWTDHDAALVLLDARTGQVRRRIASPEHVVLDDDGEAIETRLDRRAVRRIDRMLRRGGYTSLPRLARAAAADAEIEIDPETGADIAISRFTGQGLRAVVRSDLEAERAAITIAGEVSGATLAELDEEDGAAHALFVAPDRSFALAGRDYCACECVSWFELVPLHSELPGSRAAAE